MNQEIQKKILKNSISLEKFGINDLAWAKKEAEDLIVSIMKDDIGILGGDVYIINAGRLDPLYDNWSCEVRMSESTEEYFSRSKAEALNYISKYPISPKENVVFAIIFTDNVEGAE